jgi:hypothetical protein
LFAKPGKNILYLTAQSEASLEETNKLVQTPSQDAEGIVEALHMANE